MPALGGQFEQVGCDEFTVHRGAVSFEIMSSVFSKDYFDDFFSFYSCSLPSEMKGLRFPGVDLPVLGFSFFFTEENQNYKLLQKVIFLPPY